MATVPGQERSARARGLTIRVGIAPPPGLRAGAAEVLALAELLEELDYDSLWLSDVATRPGLAPLPALAAVAMRTERLKLGMSVLTLPPRNAMLLAKELATIDALSAGRLLPAGGLGIDAPVERAALGVAGPERVARLEEALTVLRLLWSGEPVTYAGRFTELRDVRLDPRPVRPRLEVWLGGRAPKALERIGRLADGWLASLVSPGELAAGADVIRAAAAAAGRTIDEDHYGTTIFSAASADDLARHEGLLRGLRPDLPVDDAVAVGADATHALLERFVAAGASKFVLIPLARDPHAYLRALRDDAVAPVEGTR